MTGQSVGSDASRLSCFLFRPRKSREKCRKRSHTNASNASVILTSRVSQTPPQTPPPYFYQWVSHIKRVLAQSSTKRPTFAFAGESGYTLGFRRKIAHKGSHGETGDVSDGGAIITLDTNRTFTNIPGPGVRTAYFAALGSWPGGALEERRKPSGQRCAYACRCPEGVAAPLGCVIFLQFGDVAVFSLCTQYFTQNFLRVQDEGGITTLVLLRVLLKRWTAACQKGSFAAFCDEICQG